MRNEKLCNELSMEFQFIIWLISLNRSHLDIDIYKIKNRINWSYLIGYAIREGIIPLLYKRITELPPGFFPVNEKKKIKNIYLNIIAKNLIYNKKLDELLDFFYRKGIDAIPIKGPVLSMQSYDDVALREYCDLDFLVKSQDFPLVIELMISQGYQSLIFYNDKIKYFWKLSGRDFHFFKNQIYIDLHQRLIQGPLFFKLPEEEWRNLITVSFGSMDVKVLSPEYTIILLSLHGTKHIWSKLKVIVDFAYFLFSINDIRWPVVFSIANRMGCYRIFCASLKLSHDILGLEIPLDILAKFEGDIKINRLVERFKKHCFSDLIEETSFSSFLFIFSSLDSFKKKVQYLCFYLFTPSAGDFVMIRLPDCLYPLYFIIRPLRQLFKYIKKIFKWLLKK